MARALIGRAKRETMRKRREKARRQKHFLLQIEAKRAQKTGGPVSIPRPIGRMAEGLDGRNWSVMNVWDKDAVRSRKKDTFGNHVLRWVATEGFEPVKPSLPPAPPMPESTMESMMGNMVETEPAKPLTDPNPMTDPVDDDLNIQPLKTTDSVMLTETSDQDDLVQIV